jgi:hypothetical protein
LTRKQADNQVGHSHLRCRFVEESRKARCRALFHLDGTIGGFGNLLVKGNIGRGDRTLNLVDGDGDFSGDRRQGVRPQPEPADESARVRAHALSGRYSVGVTR